MPACDNRCTSGKEGTCKCSCGGANHGTAKKVYDVIKDGGIASVKGSGLDLDLQEAENGRIQVWNRGNKVQQYASETEFVKDLGKLIRAGRVEVTATDADNHRQLHLKVDPSRSGSKKPSSDTDGLVCSACASIQDATGDPGERCARHRGAYAAQHGPHGANY